MKQGAQDTLENLDQKEREVNLDGLVFPFQAPLEKEDSQDSQVEEDLLDPLDLGDHLPVVLLLVFQVIKDHLV